MGSDTQRKNLFFVEQKGASREKSELTYYALEKRYEALRGPEFQKQC